MAATSSPNRFNPNRVTNRFWGLPMSDGSDYGTNTIGPAPLVQGNGAGGTYNNNNGGGSAPFVYQPVVQSAGFGGSNSYNDGGRNPNQPQNDGGGNYQSEFDAPLGRFLYSQEDNVPDSEYTRCFYRGLVMGQPDNERLCKTIAGCCEDDCCPIDYQRLYGLYVLIAFVILFAVIGIIGMIICFTRGRSQEKKRKRLYNDGYPASQAGSYTVSPGPIRRTQSYGVSGYGSPVAPGFSPTPSIHAGRY